MKPYFKFILRQKPAICVSITAGFISCLNCKIRYSKLLCTLKTRFFDEFQGKKVSNPDGLRAFLTQKDAKNMFLRQCCLIEEWLYSRGFLVILLYNCSNPNHSSAYLHRSVPHTVKVLHGRYFRRLFQPWFCHKSSNPSKRCCNRPSF